MKKPVSNEGGMPRASATLIIAGCGFAGLWAALSAARVRDIANNGASLEIKLISPSPHLHIRPRFYEVPDDGMKQDVSALLASVGVEHMAGKIVAIDTTKQEINLIKDDGHPAMQSYDRLVLATGSQLYWPEVPGLQNHAFNVDQYADARELEKHIGALANKPETASRNTAIVIGGGFTGIEIAAELPGRMQSKLGRQVDVRVIVLERGPVIGPQIEQNPSKEIAEALQECRIETMAFTSVASVDGSGLTTSEGQHIAADTIIWTGGVRANSLTAEIAGEHDNFGRLKADTYLRVVGSKNILVAGDVACAQADDDGHTTTMSCQHALTLGRVAGHNAAAELLGLELCQYYQPKYVTCLDLGPWGAIFTEGWDRKIKLKAVEAKAVKRSINTQTIYPPKADRGIAFEQAAPDYPAKRSKPAK